MIEFFLCVWVLWAGCRNCEKKSVCVCLCVRVGDLGGVDRGAFRAAACGEITMGLVALLGCDHPGPGWGGFSLLGSLPVVRIKMERAP